MRWIPQICWLAFLDYNFLLVSEMHTDIFTLVLILD